MLHIPIKPELPVPNRLASLLLQRSSQQLQRFRLLLMGWLLSVLAA